MRRGISNVIANDTNLGIDISFAYTRKCIAFSVRKHAKIFYIFDVLHGGGGGGNSGGSSGTGGSGGAGLDVFEKEPLPMDSKLRKLDNVVMTPHNAFYTKEAVERLTGICVDNVENFLSGKKSNVVNL